MRLSFFHSKVFLWSLIIVLFVVLIVLTTIAFTPSNNLPTKIIPSPSPKIIDLCAPFSTDKGEISCEETKTIVLKRFLGSILKIDKNTQSITNSNENANSYKLWLITIKLDEPIKNKNEATLGINSMSGEIESIELK